MSLSNTGSRHKTVTPSPLSQSTSAVHLHAPDVEIPRRQSKRRKPFAGLFSGNHGQDAVDNDENGSGGMLHRKVSRRQSNNVLPSTASIRSAQSGMKDKRGSVLGRLAKRFSVLRKPDPAKSAANMGEHDALRPVEQIDRRPSPSSNRSVVTDRQGSVSPVKSPGSGRRIPPPSIDDVTLPATPATPYGPSSDARDQSTSSLSSIGSPVPGPLTLRNPDEPSESAVTSPTITTASLPQVQPAPPPVPVPVAAAPSHSDRQSSNERASSAPLVVPSSPVVQALITPITPTPAQAPTQVLPVQISPAQISSPKPPSNHQLSPVVHTSQPAEIPQPPSSPPLPDLPPETPASIEQSLPTTHADLQAPSPTATTERRSSISEPSQLRDLLARTATSLASIEDSPLSRASLLVNPPTPYVQSTSTLPITVSIPPVPAASEKPAPQDGTPTRAKHTDVPHVKTSNLTKGRQTETFKLVRSPSGTMYSAADIIPGMGEQWELVESPVETPKRSKKDRSTTSKEEETPTRRRGSKRLERQEPSSSTEEDDEQRRRKRSSTQKRTSVDYTRATRTPSVDAPRRSTVPERGSSASQRERRSSAKHSSAANGQVPYGEQSSFVSTRPTSEFESAADINAFKAKEAWEMERLWRARSMAYGADGAPALAIPTIRSDSRPSTILSMDIQRPGTIPSVTDLHRATTLPATANHGSSHTYFMVQTPYPQNVSHTNPNAASAPVIYAPTSSPQQTNHASPTHHQQQHHHKTYRTIAESVPFPSSVRAAPDHHLTHPPVPSNPLPEPPRLSSYRPAPIPSSLAGSGNGTSSSEYWAQYAGVATSP